MQRFHIRVAILGRVHDLAGALRCAVDSMAREDLRLVCECVEVSDGAEGEARFAHDLRRGSASLLVVCFAVQERDRAASLVKTARRQGWASGFVLVSESATELEWLDLLDQGADDFLTPPFRTSDVVPRLVRLCRLGATQAPDVARLKESLGLQRFVGQSPRLLEAIRRIPVAARCDVSVLFLGETGTGKEIGARTIHYLSPRSGGPFVPVNSGAIPVELIENELFGHETGAFTGASGPTLGLIREADGGTLFLDEIDSLPLAAQVKLLRVVQEKEYRPLGSRKTVRADVRIVTASNGCLEAAVAAGRFRRDLFYRLNVIQFHLPPLRERPGDIPLLTRHLIAKHSERFGRVARDVTPEAMRRLMHYSWPGNIRELENVVERALVVAEGARIEASDILLPAEHADRAQLSFGELKAEAITRFEREYLEAILAAHEGNITRAARAARKNRRAFWELMRKHRIRAGRDAVVHGR